MLNTSADLSKMAARSDECFDGHQVCYLIISPTMLNKQLVHGKGWVAPDVRVYLSTGCIPPTRDGEDAKIKSIIMKDKFSSKVDVLGVMEFVQNLDKKISSLSSKGPHNIIFLQKTKHSISIKNVQLLLGAYLILKLGLTAVDVQGQYKDMLQLLDADSGKGDAAFDISLFNSWHGLERSRGQGWIGVPTSKDPNMWGMIDKEAYKHYNDPLNANLHEIVPGKFLTFQGPKHLEGLTHRDNDDGAFTYRDFSPSYYADIFLQLRVSTVIRLNEPCYDSREFTSHGLEHHDLFFEEGTSPPSDVVARFFKIAADAQGVVAIHGRGAGDRASTLVALYLMRSHGFAADEAVAWMRLMRPGSVVGEQLKYLRTVSKTVRRVLAARARAPQ